MREVLTRYHDNNNHAGRSRTIKEIMVRPGDIICTTEHSHTVLEATLPPLSVQMMYYWVGVTEAVKTWITACEVCQNRCPVDKPEPPVQFCLAYGCDASSYVNPELSFHRSDTAFTKLFKNNNRECFS